MLDVTAFFFQELARDAAEALGRIDTVLKHAADDRSLAELLSGLAEWVADGAADEAALWTAVSTTLPAALARATDPGAAFALVHDCYRLVLAHEESALRDAALEGLKTVLAAAHDKAKLAETYLSLYETVNTKNGAAAYYGKCSCAHLFALIFEHLSLAQRQAAIASYVALGTDDNPVIRRAFSKSLRVAANHANTQELFEYIYPSAVAGWKNEFIETVRVESLLTLMVISRKLSSSKIEKHLIPHFATVATDGSWKVRLTFAENAHLLMSYVDQELNRRFIWPWLSALMNDSIADVSTAAYKQIHNCVKYMDEEVYQLVIRTKIEAFMTCLNDQDEDACVHVAHIIGDLARNSVRDSPAEHLPTVTYAHQFMQHPAGNVRLSIVSEFPNLRKSTALRADDPEFTKLCWKAAKDSQWRVRAELAKTIGQLDMILDIKLLFTLLLDLCDAVRKYTTEAMPSFLSAASKGADGSPGSRGSPSTAAKAYYDKIVDRLYYLWEVNSRGYCSNSAFTELNDIIKESKRNIKSYIVTKTLLRAFTHCLMADVPKKPSSKGSVETVLKDILMPSTINPLTNVRMVAWKCLSLLVADKRIDREAIEEELQSRLVDEQDADVRCLIDECSAILVK